MKLNIFHNLPYKILSIICAMVLWFFLVIFQNVIYDLEEALPVEVRNKPDGFEMVEEVPDVQIRVTAPKDEVSFLRPEDFRAYIDLSDIDDGVVEIEVDALRNNVNVVSVVPEVLPVTLENLITDAFPISGGVVGQPATGYIAESLSFRLGQVRVKGPASLIEEIAYVQFMVELQGSETDSLVGSYTLHAYDENNKIIEHGLAFAPEKVDATLNIKRIELKHELPIVLNVAEDVDEGMLDTLVLEPESVVVTGDGDVLRDVEMILTEQIDREMLQELITGKKESATLVVPEGIELVDVESVQIRIK